MRVGFCLSPAVAYLRTTTNTVLPSSRVALKKYVKANNNINATDKMFDSLFNKALKSGVEKGEFSQPKGKLYFTVVESHVPSAMGQCSVTGSPRGCSVP